MIRLRHQIGSLIAGWVMFAVYAIACLAAAMVTTATARASELGAPLLRNFSPSEYGAAVQNWGIVQDSRGVIYVSNTEGGVLEYDGVRWRRIPTPNKATIRSLAVGEDDRVYVGAVGEIGYLAPDAEGVTRYVSLLDRLSEQDRDFGDVWSTLVSPQGVYFSTFKRLIRISDHEVRVWKPAKNFHLFFKVGDEFYLREPGRGLLQLRNDELVLVPEGERFANERIHAMLPWRDAAGARSDLILIGTRTQGWFLYDGKTLTPWVTEADAAIKEAALYRAIWLTNGALAVGTLRSGVFLLDAAGHLLAHIDKSTGLVTNTVYEVFQDRQGGLWLSLDTGLARVEVNESLSYFGPRTGLEGGVFAIHRYAGTLYAGTTQGLYRLVNEPREPAHFVGVPEVQSQAWSFLEWDDSLLVASGQGVFEIRNGTVQLVRPSEQGTSSLLRSSQVPNRVFIGMQNGIGSMRRQEGRWIDEGAITSVPTNNVVKLFQQPDGYLWLGTVTDMIRVRFDDQESVGPTAIPRFEAFGMAHGLSRGPNLLYSIAGAPAFATADGIFQFQEKQGGFVADPRFANLFADGPRQVSVMEEDARGRIWMYSSNDSKNIKEGGVAVRDATGMYRWDPKPLRLIAGNGVVSMKADQNGVVWLGREDGLYRYDPAPPIDYYQRFATLIREVSARGNHLLFGGNGNMAMPKLRFTENAMRFDFSAPSFGNQPNRFQVFLQGVDTDWSQWSPEAYRDYTNIPEGTYHFRARAMNVYGVVSREAVYDFQILPPWYRTWFAYSCYLLVAAGSFAGISRWRSAALRARNEELEQLVAVRTAALQSAHDALEEQSITDALTGLKNRRYLVERIEPDVAAIRRSYQERARSGIKHTGEENRDLLVLMVDLDHFKQVNDHYGHAAGDRVLQQFSTIFKSICRETDTPVRWGGEEFLLVARFTNAESGPIIAERLRSLVAAHTFLLEDGKTLRRTCSIGFASYPIFPTKPEHFTWEDAVKLADQCLYEAKHTSRNAWVGVQATGKAPCVDDPDLDVAELDALVNNGYLQKCSSIRQAERRAGTTQSNTVVRLAERTG